MKNKVYKKSFFQRQLKALDNFGVSYQFRVGKREKFISVCGGAGFLFYIIVILAYVLKSLSQSWPLRIMISNFFKKIIKNMIYRSIAHPFFMLLISCIGIPQFHKIMKAT